MRIEDDINLFDPSPIQDGLNYSTDNKPTTVKLNFGVDVENVEVFDEPKSCHIHQDCTPLPNKMTLGLCSGMSLNCLELSKLEPIEIDTLNNMEEHYMANDNGTIYKTVKVGNFDNTSNFNTPKLNVSSFEGCPHIYGKIYWRGVIYEIQQKITETYLEEGKKTGGDWTGYKVGDFTQRFLTKESLDRAFEMLKIMM